MKKIIYHYFDSLDSTNQKLYHMAKADAPEWTVVWAREQLAGKGRRGNTWESAVGKNLTFSFLLNVDFLLVEELTYLNMWIANTLRQFLTKWHTDIQVKWPNDIIAKNKKIAGILIENTWQNQKPHQSIVGIGLNVNQSDFTHLPSATSMYNITHYEFDLEKLLKELNSLYLNNYKILLNKNFNLIIEEFNIHLFKKNQVATYEWNGEKHNGILNEIYSNGNAIIDIENQGKKEFRHGEVKLLY